MNKPDIFRKIVRPLVWETMAKVYGLNVDSPSDKQEQFANELSDALYDKIGDRLDKTTLRDIYGGEDEEDISNVV